MGRGWEEWQGNPGTRLARGSDGDAARQPGCEEAQKSLAVTMARGLISPSAPTMDPGDLLLLRSVRVSCLLPHLLKTTTPAASWPSPSCQARPMFSFSPQKIVVTSALLLTLPFR